MSRPALSLVHGTGSARCDGQMSRANAFGRLPGARLRVLPLRAEREEFLDWWARLLMRRCGGAAEIARTFACTEQAARYWLDRFSVPNGLAVDLAMSLWPEEFAARHDRREAA